MIITVRCKLRAHWLILLKPYNFTSTVVTAENQTLASMRFQVGGLHKLHSGRRLMGPLDIR